MAQRARRERRKRGSGTVEGRGGMPGSRFIWGGAVLIVAGIAILIAVSRLGAGGNGSSGATAGGRTAAPDFQITVYQGTDVVGGDKINLSDVLGQGKPVVLNFWAGRCPPCRGEMPGFQNVYDELKDQFILLGVDIGPYVGLGSREDGKQLLRDLDITYPVGTTFDASTVARYRIRGMPTTVFLTPTGEIVDTHAGFLDTTTLRSKLQNLLKVSESS
jgi:thiol-disulfide isomerase/thioredoxin